MSLTDWNRIWRQERLKKIHMQNEWKWETTMRWLSTENIEWYEWDKKYEKSLSLIIRLWLEESTNDSSFMRLYENSNLSVTSGQQW